MNAPASQRGFTFVETLVGAAVFVVIAVGILNAYNGITEALRAGRLKITASALANEQFEIIRNLPYADVGISGGIPSGKINHTQTLLRDNTTFAVETTIRNVDDPFDGVIGGAPNDTSPADHKLVELSVTCPSCKNFQPLFVTALVSPLALETASTNGALFVHAFDAAGLPVAGANVHIENNQGVPPTVFDDTTNNEGLLQIVDAPPGAEAYEITVSKTGYSQEQTYPNGAPGNPNPVKPHATVSIQLLTEISFAIDKTSTLNLESVTPTCAPVGGIDFSLAGSKLIGANPDVLKYNASHATGADGLLTLSGLEWDTYALTLSDAGYDLAGAIPLLPLALNPDTTQNVKLVLEPKNPDALLVTVKDAGTRLPLSGAEVRLVGGSIDETKTTGKGFARQTDWSGGAGQEDFIDPAKYSSSDGNIEIAAPAGDARLRETLGEYEPAGYLISSTFDTGSASNFHELLWQPQNQPPETGADSVRFQIATNNDKLAWNFVGPDGTGASFYTLATPNINAAHNGDRYLRYKMFLATADTAFTPNVAEVAFTFTSSCVPPGQAFFTGLAAGDYTLSVSKEGYGTFNDTITVSNPWQEQEVLLAP